jgi:hypothetical protein
MISKYDKLQDKCIENDIILVETRIESNSNGIYCDNLIAIDETLDKKYKTATLCEELGHYYTTPYDISDVRVHQYWQGKARKVGYELAMPIQELIEAELKNYTNTLLTKTKIT